MFHLTFNAKQTETLKLTNTSERGKMFLPKKTRHNSYLVKSETVNSILVFLFRPEREVGKGRDQLFHDNPKIRLPTRDRLPDKSSFSMKRKTRLFFLVEFASALRARPFFFSLEMCRLVAMATWRLADVVHSLVVFHRARKTSICWIMTSAPGSAVALYTLERERECACPYERCPL